MSLPSQCLGAIETWHSVQTKEIIEGDRRGGGGQPKGMAGIVFAPVTITIAHPYLRSSEYKAVSIQSVTNCSWFLQHCLGSKPFLYTA